ncbi:MAG: hypothetical protein U0168_27935 [Nannocystaceae bacterium]
MAMDLAALYARSPVWAQHVMCSIEGLRLRRLRFSADFDDRLAHARIRSTWTMAQLQSFRVARLRAMLIHAQRNVPYWRDVFRAHGFEPARVQHGDELADLPLCNKDLVVRESEGLRATALPHGVTREAVVVHTSGTTGAGLSLQMSLEALREQWAVCWRYRLWHGLRPDTWCATLGGRVIVRADETEPPFWRINWPGRQLLLSGHHFGPATARHYLRVLQQQAIPWIHGYPSMVSALADAAAELDMPLPALRFVTLASESVSAQQRERIIAGLGVRPREHYAQTESVANMSECPRGRLHVDEDHAHVEFVPHGSDGGRTLYRVIGTSLDNWHQPLLRYDLGDLVTLADEGCDCGLPGRVVEDIDGRREDMVELGDGRKVGRAGEIFKKLDFIREAQIRQHRAGEITIALVSRGPWTEAHDAKLRASVAERLGHEMAVTIALVEQLPRTAAGKLRHVVREGGD